MKYKLEIEPVVVEARNEDAAIMIFERMYKKYELVVIISSLDVKN